MKRGEGEGGEEEGTLWYHISRYLCIDHYDEDASLQLVYSKTS